MWNPGDPGYSHLLICEVEPITLTAVRTGGVLLARIIAATTISPTTSLDILLHIATLQDLKIAFGRYLTQSLGQPTSLVPAISPAHLVMLEGPRRRRHRSRLLRRFRLEGRDPGGVLVVHGAGADLARGRWPQHVGRRRR